MLAGAVLVIFGGGGVYIKYFWLPTSKAIKDTKATIEAVEKKIAKAKGNAGKLRKIQEDLERLQKKAAEAEKRLPKDEDFPAVVDTVSDLARKYNVTLSNFSTGIPKDEKHFTAITYAISGSGRYHDVGRFFASLALEERIFNVEDVTFTPSADSIGIKFKLISYKYKG